LNTLQHKKKLENILKEGYIHVDVVSLVIYEDLDDSCGADIILSSGAVVQGRGVGQVAAIFDALQSHFVKEYTSLETISLVDFNVSVDRKRLESMTTVCNASLVIKNSFGATRRFMDSSRSLSASTARVAAQTVEFYINSERAYTALTVALADAEERGRDDLVTRYTHELAEIVKATEYDL
jgi:hypothetical protein